MATDEQRVVAAINKSRYIWRPAEAISKEVGLPVDRVRTILETTSIAEIVESPAKNAQGYTLYTTREHLVHLAPPIAHHLGTQKSS